jgi:hypothetical protein
MPSRVLVHFPEPDPPRVVDCMLSRRPARGEEFPEGFTVADYHLAIGELAGERFEYEVWVVPDIDRAETPGASS